MPGPAICVGDQCICSFCPIPGVILPPVGKITTLIKGRPVANIASKPLIAGICSQLTLRASGVPMPCAQGYMAASWVPTSTNIINGAPALDSTSQIICPIAQGIIKVIPIPGTVTYTK